MEFSSLDHSSTWEAPKAQSSVVLKWVRPKTWASPQFRISRNWAQAPCFSHGAAAQCRIQPVRAIPKDWYFSSKYDTGINVCPAFVLPALWLGFQLFTPGNSPWALLASRVEAGQGATKGEGISVHSQRRSSGTSPASLHCCWSLAVKKIEYVGRAGVTKSFQEW